MKHSASFPLLSALLFLGCGRTEVVSQDISGRWEGLLSVSGMEFDIAVTFDATSDSLVATIDIPAQGAIGLDLVNVHQNGDSILFELPSGLGVASFDGIAFPDSIAGRFSQGSASGSFILRRPPAAADLPYQAVPVEIEVDGWTCRGTLTRPFGDGPFPGVVLLTGSGIQDRDETVMGFSVFGVLADSLTRRGIAVLRCDDRGYGSPPETIALLTDSILAQDAGAMLRFLEEIPEVDEGRTGFLGHSEGSTVALRAASMPGSGADFVICLAGPSIPGYGILLAQVEDIARMSGESDDRIGELVELQRRIMDAVIEGDTDSLALMIERQMREEIAALPEGEAAQIGDVDAYVSAATAQSVAVLESPWFFEFLTFDPAESASGCSCPILAVYGSLDVQVDAGINSGPMEEAVSSDPYSSVVVIEGANHLFQTAVTGGVEEYQSLEQAFVPELPALLSDWIQLME